MTNNFLAGAGFACFLAASVFFLKYWKTTKDSLFAMFSLAFLLLGVERIFVALPAASSEHAEKVYVIRLIAYCLILVGIIHKNRKPQR